MATHLTTSAAAIAEDRGELISIIACLGNAIQAEPEAFYERPLQAWPEWISEQGFDSQCLIDWVNAAAQTNNLSTTQLHQFYAEQAKSGSTTARFLAQLHERSPQFVEVLRASMQELGEEAESLQQVAGGTAALKGHPGDIAMISVGGAIAGAIVIGSLDHFFNKGRLRKYLFESRGTGEAGNIAQDGEQVILRDDQQLIKNAIENSSLVERQKSNLIIRPEQEAQADAARAVAVRKDPDLLIKEAKKALNPEETRRFVQMVASNGLNDLEEASWKEIESKSDFAVIKRSLSESIEEIEATIKDLDKKITEELVKAATDHNLDDIARKFKDHDGPWDKLEVMDIMQGWSIKQPIEAEKAWSAYQKLNNARMKEQWLVNQYRAKDAHIQFAYKRYWKDIIDENTALKNELEIKAAKDAGGAAANHIDKELNQAISAEAVSMADNAMENGDVQIINAAEQAVSEELKIEVEEIEDEMESAVEKEEDKVISNLVD